MNNLHETGTVLRTLKPGLSYEKLLSDVNYNFVQILHSPGFKGIPGQSIKGPPGETVRGSKWIFIDEVLFKAIYPSIQSGEQITLAFINSEFSNNPTKFFTSIYIPNDSTLILGDTIVLPSGVILELVVKNETTKFVDTGITFSQISSITREEIIMLIEEYLIQTGENSSGLVFFNAEAKNSNDTQPSLNTNYTQGSVVDIDVTGSGPGYPLTNYKVIAPSELAVNETSKFLLLAGSAKAYHQLIQNTQTDFTNAYAPQVNTLPALVVMQNNFNNGIMFGNQEDSTFRNFGRLFKTSSGVYLTSSNSPNREEYSGMTLSDSEIILETNITSILSKNLNLIAENITGNTYQAYGPLVKLGGNALLDTDFPIAYQKTNTSRLILAATKSIVLRNASLFNASILSTDNTGAIQNINKIVNAINPSIYEVPTSKAVNDALAAIRALISSSGGNVNDELNQYFGSRTDIKTTSINLNTLAEFGSYNIDFATTISNGPDIIKNTNLPSISAPSNVATKNIFLNVFRIKLSDVGGLNYAICQEMYYPVPYNYSSVNINEQRYVKFHRIGKVTASNSTGTIIASTSWGAWNRSLDALDTFKSKNTAIEVTGSFLHNNLSIEHKEKASTLGNQANTGKKVLQSIEFDDFGHVTKVVSTDLTSEFEQTNIDLTAIKQRLAALEIIARPFSAGGGMVLFNKPVSQIPAGWREVTDAQGNLPWRGRLPIGYDPAQIEFNQVGNWGGAKSIIQTIGQMPKHSHTYSHNLEKVGNGNRNSLSKWTGNEHGNATTTTGGNEAMNILNPYRIAVFIELIPVP